MQRRIAITAKDRICTMSQLWAMDQWILEQHVMQQAAPYPLLALPAGSRITSILPPLAPWSTKTILWPFYRPHVCPGPHEDTKMAMQHTKPFSRKIYPTSNCFLPPSSPTLLHSFLGCNAFSSPSSFRLVLKTVPSDSYQFSSPIVHFGLLPLRCCNGLPPFQFLVPFLSRTLSTHHGHPCRRQFGNCHRNDGFITVFTVFKLFEY